jgi:hypothetical protein
MKTQPLQSDKFNFFIPLDIEKGADGQLTKIKGICSSDKEDSDGETLIPAGFDFAPLLKSGFLNWNHQARTTSKAICGEPTSAAIINGGKDFYIEGVLYPNTEGKHIVELAETLEKHSPNRRLGFSIEGQAIERDILNPKKVLRATITGVAITQSPKNPNTLMNIVKGEYADEFIDEGFHEQESQPETIIIPKFVKLTITCDESSIEQVKQQLLNLDVAVESEEQLDKAMTVNVDINPPSIEGANKKDTLVNLLKKSDIYNQINKRYTNDFEKAEQIYQFINQVKDKYMITDNITPEVLSKAFSLLDESILEKSEEQKSLADYDKKDEVADDGDEDDKNKEVEKAKDAASSDDDDDDDDFEKAMNAESFAKSLFEKGLSEDEVIKAMTSVGVSLTLTETACSNCIAQANAEKQGGNITTLVKSEDAEEDDKTDKLIKGFGEAIDKKFSALGIILKAAGEREELSVKKIQDLEKSNQELEQSLQKLSSQPNERRAATTAKALERFEKSADGVSVIENFDSSNAQDMKNLSNRLFKEVELLKSQGHEDRGLEKAVADLEIAKSTNFQAIGPRLRALNIKVY